MATGDRTGGVRNIVRARGWWKCDGCGRMKEAGSHKRIVTENRVIVAELCVLCCLRPEGEKSEAVAALVEHGIRECDDPFTADMAVAIAWEEVFGSSGDVIDELIHAEYERGSPAVLNTNVEPVPKVKSTIPQP